MIHFTKYAEQKFDILNKHKVYFTYENVKEVINLPDKVKKGEKYFHVQKEGISVIYKKEGENIHIITFYPIKI